MVENYKDCPVCGSLMVTFKHGEFCTSPNCRLTHPPLCPRCGVWNAALCSCNALNTEDSRTKDCLVVENAILRTKVNGLEAQLADWRENGSPMFQITPYDPEFGDNRICDCGHEYHRHFDSYENMDPVGCKYCQCFEFREPSAPENCSKCDYVGDEEEEPLACEHDRACREHGNETGNYGGKPLEVDWAEQIPRWCPRAEIVRELLGEKDE